MPSTIQEKTRIQFTLDELGSFKAHMMRSHQEAAPKLGAALKNILHTRGIDLGTFHLTQLNNHGVTSGYKAKLMSLTPTGIPHVMAGYIDVAGYGIGCSCHFICEAKKIPETSTV